MTGGMGPASGSPAMGDPAGSAEVHSGLHSGRTTEEYSGLGFAEGTPGSAGGVKERVLGTARTVRDSAGELAGTVRHRAESLGHRAGEAASEARTRLSAMSERTNRALDQRGLLARLEENPLPALGIAFGLGFLLAGGGRGGQANTPASRMRRELRGALMAGLTAGAAQATRGFLQTAGGPEGIFNALAGNRTAGGERGTTSRASGARMSSGLGEEEIRSPGHLEDL